MTLLNCSNNNVFWDFAGGPPVVKNLLSNAGDADLIPGWGTKIPQVVWYSKKQNKTKQNTKPKNKKTK